MDSRARIRSVFDAIAGVGFIATLLLGVFLIVLLGDRARGQAGAGSQPATVGASSDATFTPQSLSPLQRPSDGPVASPGATATATPSSLSTPGSTPKVTRAPRPTGDPRPEGTAIIYSASGHLGQTIVNRDLAVRVDTATMPPTFEVRLCGGDDPEMQGYTEAFAFELTLSWTGSPRISDPHLEIGDHPHSLMWFDHVPAFANAQPEVVVVCHRPEESNRILVGVGLNGVTPMTEYHWTIR